MSPKRASPQQQPNPAKKRRQSLSAADQVNERTAAIQAAGADLVSNAHALTLSKIQALLEPRGMAGVASQVLALVENGGLTVQENEQDGDGDLSPPANNKWNLMSREYNIILLTKI
eukprot:16430321-Heterocapsa_arctica.AAC.1